MSHQGHSQDDFVIPVLTEPTLKCESCDHYSDTNEYYCDNNGLEISNKDKKKLFWCKQHKLKAMWHTTGKDRFCYMHSKWRDL